MKGRSVFFLSASKPLCRYPEIPNFEYQEQGHELSEVQQEKDLGVIISNTLRMSDQSTAASNKANMMSGLISRNFGYKSPELIEIILSICKSASRICCTVLVTELGQRLARKDPETSNIENSSVL